MSHMTARGPASVVVSALRRSGVDLAGRVTTYTRIIRIAPVRMDPLQPIVDLQRALAALQAPDVTPNQTAII